MYVDLTKIKYDVVILTHKPKECLLFSIENLVSQSITPTKIIIYNTDKELFKKRIKNKSLIEEIENNKNYKNIPIEIIHIEKKDFDHGKARNSARKYSSAEYLLYMTDDAIPYDSEMVENLLNSFVVFNNGQFEKREDVALIYARQMPKKDAKYKEILVRQFNYTDKSIIKDKSTENVLGIKNYFVSNACAMYDLKIFDKLKGFKEGLMLNEDSLYAYKSINEGYKVIYCAHAKVYHSHNFSYIEQYKRNYAIGVSHIENEKIFGNLKTTSEGKNLVKYVTIEMLKRLKFISLIDFYIECVFRYLGYRKGKNDKSITKKL